LWSPSYNIAAPWPTRRAVQPSYDGAPTTRSTAMNTIIYIVGLIVVIGFVLSFFGLR
jgi:hypothetical protein